MKSLSEIKEVFCPRCYQQVTQVELNEYLSIEEKKEIDKQQAIIMVQSNQNLFLCKYCNNVMELEEGVVVKGQKDDKGKIITEETAKHMAKYRIRCNGCQKNFCSRCNFYPYHIGKTCEQNVAKVCRFCNEELKVLPQGVQIAFKDVCSKSECQNFIAQSCNKLLACSHVCHGPVDELICCPCLEQECITKMIKKSAPVKDAKEFCTICFSSFLGQEPCVVLTCNHVFHVGCLKRQVEQGYNGPRIVFNFINCPDCKQRMNASQQCESLHVVIEQNEQFEMIIKQKALVRAKHEELDKDPRLQKKGDRFYQNLQGFAIEKLSYYMCYKCKNPYFGGMKQCDAVNEYDKFKKEELVCGKCSAEMVGAGDRNCKKHGSQFIEFKCKFCCNISQWFCWGNTHFCEKCHRKQCNGDYVSQKTKKQLPKCTPQTCNLKSKHPPNGEEWAMGCSVCNNMKENMKDF